MKKISALVPQGEHFDESAMNAEGIWFTPKHVNAIEAALGANDTVVANLNVEKNDLQTQLGTAQSEVTAANTSLATANARVAALEAENATLKKQPAADFAETTKPEDSNAVNPKAKYMTSIDEEAAAYLNIK